MGDPAALPDSLLLAIGDEMSRFARRRIAVHADSVLEGSAFRILTILVRRGPQTLRDLADDIGLEQSTISRQVNATIRHGLVERFDSENARLVRATPAGAEAFEHDGRLRGNVIQTALAELGTDRAHQLARELKEFNDALDRANSQVPVEH